MGVDDLVFVVFIFFFAEQLKLLFLYGQPELGFSRGKLARWRNHRSFQSPRE
jgi:hypothetical protein